MNHQNKKGGGSSRIAAEHCSTNARSNVITQGIVIGEGPDGITYTELAPENATHRLTTMRQVRLVAFR